MPHETLFICINCPTEKTGEIALPSDAGAGLLRALTELLSQDPVLARRLSLKPVKCMGGCENPCTVAMCAPFKETLLFGGLSALNARDVLAAAALYVSAQEGERLRGFPESMLGKNFIVRIPAALKSTP